eukprot:scaffold104064_cov26-Tisochrysis_lutea.AAC.1
MWRMFALGAGPASSEFGFSPRRDPSPLHGVHILREPVCGLHSCLRPMPVVQSGSLVVRVQR